MGIFSEGSKLSIVTDVDTAYAGTVVSGRVYAIFKQPPPPTARLMLGFYGSETTRCKWQETVSSTSWNSETQKDETSSSTYTYTAAEEFPVLSLEWVLADLTQSGGGAPGSYEYPFSFRLPVDLPSSLCATSGSAMVGQAPKRCRLTYGLRTGLLTAEEAADAPEEVHNTASRTSGAAKAAQAVVKGIKAAIGAKVKKWALLAEAPLVLHAKVQEAVLQKSHETGPLEKRIPQTCLSCLFCCGTPGSVMMSVAFCDKQLGPGQTVCFAVAVRNYSARSIREMLVSIEEKVRAAPLRAHRLSDSPS